MGVLDRETELEKHTKMVTDVVVQDCKDRGCLLLLEVLTAKGIGRNFSKYWMLAGYSISAFQLGLYSDGA